MLDISNVKDYNKYAGWGERPQLKSEFFGGIEMIYLVHEENMAKLAKKMTRIANKCKKYGCDFHFEEVGETFETTEGGEVVRYIQVDVEGKAIINDWQFVATIDYVKSGNVVRSVAGEEVPARYLNEAPICEHCHTNHNRVHTYIVKNVKTGEYKQVGKSCLCDYTHGMSAEMAADALKWVDEFVAARTYYGGGKYYFKTQDIVELAIATIAKYGYISRQKQNELSFEGKRVTTTADEVKDYYKVPGQAQKDGIETTEETEVEAKKMIEWAKNVNDVIAEGCHNDYLHNLKVLANTEYLDGAHVGMMVSLPVAYKKAIDKKAAEEAKEEKAAESAHVGNVGDKINVDVASAQKVGQYSYQYGYDYENITYIYIFTDKNRNTFKWATAKVLDCDNIKSISGKIKEHAEYRGVKQTVLTRCKVS